MSWWIAVTCDCCKHELNDVNITSNVSRMVQEAGGFYWDDLDEKSGAVALPLLEKLLTALRAEPARFDAMNPENGWGSRAVLEESVASLVETLRKYEATTVTAHG